MRELNDRHKEVLRNIAKGMKKIEAWTEVYPSTDRKNASGQVNKLLKKELAQQFLENLREEANKLASVELSEGLEYCAIIIRKSKEHIKEGTPAMAQAVTVGDGLRALDKLCKINGWDKTPESIVKNEYIIRRK